MEEHQKPDQQEKSVPAVVASTPSTHNGILDAKVERFPHNISRQLSLFQGHNGVTYAELMDAGNRYVIAVGSRQLNLLLSKLALEQGERLRKTDLLELNEHLRAQAEMSGIARKVWYRVAPIEDGGIEVDVGDENHTRIRIRDGKVEIVPAGSETLFFRTKSTKPMVLPAATGNIELLKKYLNMHPAAMVLFIGWLSYTLAHPKADTTKYVILVLQGNQGSGKSSLCKNVILALIDPSVVGVQLLPTNPKDLAIAAQNAHVLCYDNVRGFKQAIADNLCVASTGGSITSRQLYTDSDQQILHLHAAIVLNGIHSFIDQPDLAQRCLPIELLPMKETNRKSEAEIVRELQADLPEIFRGLLDLIAQILMVQDTVEVTNPERMYDFARWLAAMEKVLGAPAGVYQAEYSLSLKQGQLDSLLDDILAATLVTFAQGYSDAEWSGTPAKLLGELNRMASPGILRTREWPLNPIALSKRLKPLQAALASQGIQLQFSRGKERTITITVTVEKNHEAY